MKKIFFLAIFFVTAQTLYTAEGNRELTPPPTLYDIFECYQEPSRPSPSPTVPKHLFMNLTRESLERIEREQRNQEKFDKLTLKQLKRKAAWIRMQLEHEIY